MKRALCYRLDVPDAGKLAFAMNFTRDYFARFDLAAPPLPSDPTQFLPFKMTVHEQFEGSRRLGNIRIEGKGGKSYTADWVISPGV